MKSVVLSLKMGSSPLARGLPGQGHSGRPELWIIPARAGFTSTTTSSSRTAQDHPRSRGVYHRREVLIRGWRGSSPLARGLRRGTARPRRGWRIIPARAGFTRSAPESSPRLRDHPRSRGVYTVTARPESNFLGSSPLARGLHILHGARISATRIIPARAGFTAVPRSHDD